MNLKINNSREDCIIGEKGIEHFEQKYNATYVSDLCLKTSTGTWAEAPSAIFYQKTAPQPGYSHYFGVFVRGNQTYITSGQSAIDETIKGIVADDGEVIFSRFRHDYRTSKDGSVFIDGGRDYTKCSNPERLVDLSIVDGEILISSKLNNNLNSEHKKKKPGN